MQISCPRGGSASSRAEPTSILHPRTDFLRPVNSGVYNRLLVQLILFQRKAARLPIN